MVSSKISIRISSFLAITCLLILSVEAGIRKDSCPDKEEIVKAASSAITNYQRGVTRVGGGKNNPSVIRVNRALSNVLSKIIDEIIPVTDIVGFFPIWLLVNLIISLVLVIIYLANEFIAGSVARGENDNRYDDWYKDACDQLNQFCDNNSEDLSEVVDAAKKILYNLLCAVKEL